MNKGKGTMVGVALVCALILPVGVLAGTSVIDDSRDGLNTYYGGTASGSAFTFQDVIPDTLRYWDLTRMEVTDTGSKLQVKIVGPWFDQSDLYSLLINSGDLYISSTGWRVGNAEGSPHYPYDTFTSAEGWNYVVTGRWVDGSGIYRGYQGGVYTLDYGSLKMTDPTYALAAGRLNQAYYGGWGQAVGSATVTFNNTLGDESYMLYEFDKFLSGNIGLHWTMYCGNDVIEGEVTLTPEPGTTLLLVLGLIGLCWCERRRSGAMART